MYNYADILWDSIMGNNVLQAALAITKLKESNGLNHEDQCGRGFLHYAVMQDTHEIVKLLLDAGVEVNQLDDLNWSPLMQAVFMGNTETAKLLIVFGAKTDVRNNIGQSIFQYAVQRDMTDIFPKL